METVSETVQSKLFILFFVSAILNELVVDQTIAVIQAQLPMETLFFYFLNSFFYFCCFQDISVCNYICDKYYRNMWVIWLLCSFH